MGKPQGAGAQQEAMGKPQGAGTQQEVMLEARRTEEARQETMGKPQELAEA